MGWYHTVHGPLTCPVCGRESEGEADLAVPMPPEDGPEYLAVGDRLEPFSVSSLDYALLQLRPREDAGQGLAIVMWTCPHCAADYWALLGLADAGGVAQVTSFDACPMAPESLERADWIHPAIVASLIRGTIYDGKIPLNGLLTDEQRDLLGQCLLAYLARET